jgi:hypothetical protein
MLMVDQDILMSAEAILTASAFALYVVAGSPFAPKKVLQRLAKHATEKVRMRVAENPETPEDILEELIADNDSEVRLAVAENPHTPGVALSRLAHDDSADVRYGLAENPNLPLRILQELAEDENPYVACRAEKTLHSFGYMACATGSV